MLNTHKDCLIQRQGPWATVNSIRLIKHTPFNQERTINVWIDEIEKQDVLGPRNYGGSPVQRHGRPFPSLGG